MKYIIVLLVLALGSCAPKDDSYKGVPTTEHNALLEQFNSDLQSLGYSKIDFSNTTVYVDDNQTLEGKCWNVALQTSGRAEITLNKNFKNLHESQKMLLMYHELGHCFLGLYHTDGLHVMNPTPAHQPYQYSDLQNIGFRQGLVDDMVKASNYR